MADFHFVAAGDRERDGLRAVGVMDRDRGSFGKIELDGSVFEVDQVLHSKASRRGKAPRALGGDVCRPVVELV